MNSGLQDAFNLAWKLARVCQGISAPALLDSYEAERRPVAKRIAASGDEFEQAQSLTDPAKRRARDKALQATFADRKLRHHESIAEAELDIDYSDSPIVMGDKHKALAPGQRLCDTIGVNLANGNTCLLHELTRRAGHTALVIGSAAVQGERHSQLEKAVRAGSADAIEATVALCVEPDDRNGCPRLALGAAQQLGIDELTLLIIRPDGHIGLRADHNHVEALAAYQSLLETGVRPTR